MAVGLLSSPLHSPKPFIKPQIIISGNSSHRIYRKPRFSRSSSEYASFEVRDVSYRAPGTEHNLLNGVSFSLRERSFGLIFGRSGSGKTTLLQLQSAFHSVGLDGISLDQDPHSLSGGFKRRLALAIQLVQKPDLLLLDEPLAGLDWKSRVDVTKLLKNLKKELTILVVSHDLKELSFLVDRSWRMDMGGFLREEPLPL